MSSNKILFLVITFASLAAGATCRPATWTANEKDFTVCYDMKTDALLSESCINGSCDARTFLDKVRGVKLPSEGVNPHNPGSKYCRWVQGTVVIARNARGSQTAFCQGSDGTLVDLAGLAEYADDSEEQK
ncbi:DUF333 domain-containing protein [Bdellovibrio sp. NC01]|uniref:DUF333 domain-containing protein n=1 Tax=Bdellovibrio sp. NC01 TaxID=2220073 RepID=UPI001158E124|nr:DUF333 domain-containing protein [Bdellovibrio sp. NC01]QDK36764.1 hypothetical protein DOE51_03685 [Bdellovibrio sp. NC01]